MLLFRGAGTAALLSVIEGAASLAAGREALRKEPSAGVIFVGTTPEEAGYTAADLAGRKYAVLSDRSSPLSEKAGVLMPLLPWTEKEGTMVSLEGRELTINRGPLSKKTGSHICAILASAALPLGAPIPSNPTAR